VGWTLSLDATCIPCDIAHYSIAEQTQLPRIIRDTHASLFYSMHFNVPMRCPVPFVATIHDMILHAYPNNASFIKRIAYRSVFHHTIRNAERLCVVSDAVRDELLSAYGSPLSSRLFVTHEGVDSTFHRRSELEQRVVLQKFGIDKPFFLYIGNAKEHKNVGDLLNAWKQFDSSSMRLVLVTGGKEANRLVLPEGVIRVLHIADGDLPALYSAAIAYVSASRYEGFGLPFAEAIACGCPVIAYDLPIVREVTRGKGVVTAHTPHALADAMRRPPSRIHPECLWRWEDAAEKTAEVLAETLTLIR
jgi:alpha-1,3-rhamnosyl/mannosyltransferase